MKEKYKISLVYAVIGLLWIYFSDAIILFLFPGLTASELTYFQSYKGFLYVLLTTLILYFFLDKTFGKMQEKIDLAQSSEKRFNNIFESTPIPIFIIDKASNKILNVNESGIKTYGYSKEELIGLTYTNLMDDEVQFLYEKYLGSSFDHLTDSPNVFTHKKKNGELFSVEERSSEYVENQNSYKIVIAFDLTRIGRTEKDLRRSKENIIMLEEKERNKYSSELHNGIGQYLVVIKQVSALLSETGKDDKNAQLFNLITESADSALKECRRITHDLSPKELYSEGLKKLLVRAIERMDPSLSIEMDIDDRMDAMLDIHSKFHLYRIFQENLNNTLKHSNGSKIVLHISIDQNEIHYLFNDNGVGLNEELIQSDKSFITIRKRVEFLKGKLLINNLKDGGANFEISFPPVYKIVLN